MHIMTLALILSIVSAILSFAFVGVIPSIAALILNIKCITKEKSIKTVRALSISIVGVLVPVIMYLSCYGFHLPYKKAENAGMVTQILYDNYTRLGFDVAWMVKDKAGLQNGEMVAASKPGSTDMYYVSDGVAFDDAGAHIDDGMTDASDESADDNEKKSGKASENTDEKGSSLDDVKAYVDFDIDNSQIFEAIDSNRENGKMEVGKSDDDMPSYGGLPIGTIIVGQYFREDDHNCNPILVLQNKTGKTCRFECLFTARDEEGEELATSKKTVEVVKNDALFIFEGRFDKNDLGGEIPAMYEFLVSKREPYEDDMFDEVSVAGQINNFSVIVTAQNHSDKRVKVDTYVLFFDKNELVDCIWMIPRNGEEVCINPGSAAAIRADAYYRFDRIETYYTAYEAVSG